MKSLPVRARVYTLGVTALAAAVVVRQFLVPSDPADWPVVACLSVGAILAQLFPVVTPNQRRYYLTPAFLFAAVALLGYRYLALVILVGHVSEWVKVPGTWRSRAFDVATHLVAGYAGRFALVGLLAKTNQSMLTGRGAIVVLGAAITFTAVQNILVGCLSILSRTKVARGAEAWSAESLLADLALACLGATGALLFLLDVRLIVLLIAPLALMYRALNVPTLREEAQRDAKTGLCNARRFHKLLSDELRRARRFGRPLAVVMADLDGLRLLNNTYGHLAGDTALAVVGKTLREQLRDFDVAARFGGEEFVLMMPETTTDAAVLAADRIRAVIASTLFSVRGHAEPISVTITMGVSGCPADGNEVNELIQAADAALYEAKAAGKNQVKASGAKPKIRTAVPLDADVVEDSLRP